MQINKKSTTPLELGYSLSLIFKKNQIKQIDVEVSTGVNQSQISRILNGDFKNIESKSVKKICEYAELELELNKKLATKRTALQSVILINAINSVWNGDIKQEKLLAKLIRAMKPALNEIKGGGVK